MKQFILINIFCLVWIFGQSQSPHRVNLTSGIAFHNFQDYNYSPLKYVGSNIFYGIDYHFQSDKSRFETGLLIQSATLSNGLSSGESVMSKTERTLYSGNLRYLYQLSVPNTEIYVGASTTVIYDLMPYNFNANNLVSYELTGTLNAAANITHRFNKDLSFTLKADLPMISASVRPMDEGFFHMNNMEFDLGKALSTANFYPTNKIFFLHFQHLFEYKFNKYTLGVYYDYQGGYNKVIDKKGSAVQKIGIVLPISSLFTK